MLGQNIMAARHVFSIKYPDIEIGNVSTGTLEVARMTFKGIYFTVSGTNGAVIASSLGRVETILFDTETVRSVFDLSVTDARMTSQWLESKLGLPPFIPVQTGVPSLDLYEYECSSDASRPPFTVRVHADSSIRIQAFPLNKRR